MPPTDAPANGARPLVPTDNAMAALVALVREVGAAVQAVDARLEALEGLLEEYRPLLDMAKARAEKSQGSWRGRFATGGNPGG